MSTPTRPGHRESTDIVRQRAGALFDDGIEEAARDARKPEPPPPGRPRAPLPLPAPAPVPAPAPGLGLGRRARWRLALLERLPSAARLRFGLDMKAVGVLAVVAIVAVVFAVQHLWSGRPRSVSVPAAVSGPSAGVPRPAPAPGATPVNKPVVVDVAGKVHDPGVLKLASGSRVGDALRAAGGALPGADTSSLNLARVLVDGEQVVVGAPAAAPPSPGPASTAGPVSLSSATADQLETLPGVGPVLAQHIIDYRTQHGGFTSVDQLREVTGIGNRRFSDLRSLVQP
ncbi:hypothetical protein GCM10012280_03560 [Wenjunlia tyrosinilytica]|uniref:Soluble ligand binding domain-containing protein n=2 Tax=Wenjunlia tyrosinilytica TaxID=1544741 RepID=A0A917ZF91_9ACTN|nr:hypothetical protein GCM10012280_03560 [Wenjunlia tyrosinilytica]